MNKKLILIVIIGVMVLLAISTFIAIKYRPNIFVSFPATNNGGKESTSSEIIFFYGNGCPHCARVEQYLADNKVDSQIKIDKKEVYGNRDNAALLGDKAHSCGLDASSVGIPFVWDGTTGKCVIGDQDVINYFQQKIKQ